MKKLIVSSYATVTSFVLSAVVGVGTAAAQYASATPEAAATASDAKGLAEAGLYGVGLLFLVGLVVLLYVYAPKAKRSSK